MASLPTPEQHPQVARAYSLPPSCPQTNNELEAQRVATEFAFRKRLREMEKLYSELKWQEKNVSLVRVVSWGTDFRPGSRRLGDQVEMGRSVPADLGGDCRAAGGHPAPGGGPAQKVTEPEAVPHPARGQDLPAQRGTLQGPGSRAARRGPLLRFLGMTHPHPLVEQGCWRTAPPLTPKPGGRRLVWLTWDSQPAPLPPGTVRPHRRGSPVGGNHCHPEAEAGAGTVGLGSGQEGRGDTAHHRGPWLPAGFPAGFLAQGC